MPTSWIVDGEVRFLHTQALNEVPVKAPVNEFRDGKKVLPALEKKLGFTHLILPRRRTVGLNYDPSE